MIEEFARREGKSMTMKKVAMIVFLILVLMVISQPARSQTTQVVLGSPVQGVTFTGTGSSDSTSMDLGSCSGTACTLSGVAFGTGLLNSKGPYNITSPNAIPLELTDPSTGLWTAITDGNSMNFSYGAGGTLLTGFLNLLQFDQVSSKQSGSQNWYLTSASLTVTGGSLQVSDGMQLQLHFSNVPVNFNGLLGSANAGKTETIVFGHGNLTPTPEVTSVLLLGAGFLLVGGFLRFRSRRSIAC
jgi:hypothetical protein